FLIPFIGLKDGLHRFDFKIDNKFFEGFDFLDFQNAHIQVSLIFEKKTTLLELNFSAKGQVTVPCDITTEPFKLPIDTAFKLVVKFGSVENDDDDEILILPHGSHEIQIAQYIYEMIVLSVPQKKVHPGIAEGTLKSEILEKLKDLQPQEKPISDETDPRWDKLKDLLK
ncbi:MAG: YceD family protein, partial [Flavobacteriaceae bacterium]